ncbi:MAG: DUF6607 family protein [Verrucomicrobiota bacterium]
MTSSPLLFSLPNPHRPAGRIPLPAKFVALALLFFLLAGTPAMADKFERDREAILSMAGAFEVEFNFEETTALKEGYELDEPYQARALEVVKVVEDTGDRIVLQHLLMVGSKEKRAVIKHWGQVWQYEDPRSLTYQGDNTWLPVTHSPEETKGTWTQFVTQVDDSPRYKAQGHWDHQGNTSVWTSRLSTRPLPRRDAKKRSDYDLLVVTNTHVITPSGWTHQQDNRKLVNRDGQSQFLCVENGLNRYERITDEEKLAVFQPAHEYWDNTHQFWKEVRTAWLDIVATSDEPIHYHKKVEGKRLMSRMHALSREASDDPSVNRTQVDELIAQYMQ